MNIKTAISFLVFLGLSVPVSAQSINGPIGPGPQNLQTFPYFSGTLVTSAQTVSNAAWAKVSLDTVMDPNGFWSATNHNYLPTLAGHYQVCAGSAGSGTSVTQMAVAVAKNGLIGTGSTITEGINVGLATAPTQTATASCAVVAMNGSSDTLEMDVNLTGTGTLQVSNSAGLQSFFIRWVGP